MKHIIFVLLLTLCLSGSALAERETLFKGFNSKIVSIVDDMTDKKSGVIFLDFGPIYMAVYGSDDFLIWANSDDLIFASDAAHLIRVGKNKPFTLTSLRKREGLALANAVEARSVIKSIANGEEVKLRYHDWPRYDVSNIELQNKNFGFVYHRAAKIFGWKDLGVPHELAPVKLDIHEFTGHSIKGHVQVRVKENRNLSLSKTLDKYGVGATIDVGYTSGFGFQNGQWMWGSMSRKENNSLIIRDSDGNIVFKEALPSSYTDPVWPERIGSIQKWPVGKMAAMKAWEVAPLGSIEAESDLPAIYNDENRALLYGFRELWKWGVDNAGFPPLE